MRTNKASNALLKMGALAVAASPGGRRPEKTARILIVRLGNIGDIVVALPAFHALRKRFPTAHMTLLTSPTERGAPGARELLAGDPTFNEQIVYYADESSRPGFLRGLRARIRALDIDLAVLLPNHLAAFSSLAKYLALLGTSGVRRVAGCQLVTPTDYTIRQVERLANLLAPLEASDVEPFPWLRAAEEDKARAKTLLGDAGERLLVGMHCGAKRPANRWPVERFAEVGRRLIEMENACIALTGAAGEAELTSAVARQIGGGCIDLAGKTSILEAAAVAQQCRVFVSNDTGMMHVAYAMGTPVVAVFGGRFFPTIWYPYGEGHTVLREDIECSPCQEDICPLYGEPECLQRIEAREVLDAVRTTLAPGRR